jgi:hypothetical protein
VEWVSLLGYVTMLVQGWLVFVSKIEDDAQRILGEWWLLGHLPLLLKY